MNRLTNTQLTIIIVTALLCLGLPAGALAANVSKVAIAGNNGKTAKVKAGKLQVGATVSGTVKTSQQGTVTTQPAPPSAFHQSTSGNIGQGSGCYPIATAPSNSALVIRQLRIDVYLHPTINGDSLIVSSVSTCAVADIAEVAPAGIGQVVVPFDPGVAIGAGESLYIAVSGDMFLTAFADGYRVPASQVP